MGILFAAYSVSQLPCMLLQHEEIEAILGLTNTNQSESYTHKVPACVKLFACGRYTTNI